MNAPSTVHVPLRIRDVEDAIRWAQALDAALHVIWEAYGEQMGERMLEQHCADSEADVDSLKLPF